MWWPIFLLLALFCSGSHQQCFTKNDATQFIAKPQINAWKLAQQNFSVTMFQMLNSMDNQKDVVFSPVSIYEALLLSYFGATHDTEKTLARILNLPPNENKGKIWRLYYTQSLVSRNKIRGYPLKIANRFYLTHRLRLRPCMDRKMRGELELVDYETDPKSTQAYINNWVEKQTDGKIKDYIRGINKHTPSTLVSAAFFNGKWDIEFDRMKTEPKTFHVNDRSTRSVQMMYKIDTVLSGYAKMIGASMIVLNYEGSDVGMIILRPQGSLDDMIASLNAKALEYITDRRNYDFNMYEIHIPKIEFGNELSINKMFSALKADTFTQYANFTGFTGRPEVFLNSLNHQAVIEVNEEGTKSSMTKSAYSEAVYYRSMTFICDHPFAYIIHDFAANKVLIMGTFRNPPP